MDMSIEQPARSLRDRVISAGGWTALGYASAQAMRFGSNLLMTRLLFPEAFGLMVIVQAVMTGVAMLSDVGIGQSIVRNANGARRSFVDTAWTVQIIKGFVVGALLWALAVPVSSAYGLPSLAELIPVAALAALAGGFNSTNISLASRRVETGRVTAIELGSLAIGLAASLAFATIEPSAWALVWGNLLAAVVKMLASHVLLHGARNRLAWDREALGGILGFGGWVLLSSALTYLTGEGNKLILAGLLDVRLIGLIGLASTINLVLWQAIRQMGSRVLFPAYSEVVRANPARLSQTVERARWVQVLPAWVFAALLAGFGPVIIGLLYDDRYRDAGVVLQVLAMSQLVGVLTGSYGGVLWALGKMKTSIAMSLVQALMQIGAIVIGAAWYGKAGAVFGYASAAWLLYPVHAVVYGRLGLWQPRLDLPVLLGSLAVVAWVVGTRDFSAMWAW